MKIQIGSHDAAGLRFGIVASKFNETVSGRLLAEAIKALRKAGVKEDDVKVVRVPGAFEIPLVARQLARSGQCDAVICLGAVIRGDTPHFDYIAGEASRGIMRAAMETNVPVVFGVLTTETVAQAAERADPRKYNRGAGAAETAIEMAKVMRQLEKEVLCERPVPRPSRMRTPERLRRRRQG